MPQTQSQTHRKSAAVRSARCLALKPSSFRTDACRPCGELNCSSVPIVHRTVPPAETKLIRGLAGLKRFAAIPFWISLRSRQPRPASTLLGENLAIDFSNATSWPLALHLYVRIRRFAGLSRSEGANVGSPSESK
jgi:hypothetical protein